MSKPLIMEIPHELGKEEARRRIEGNVDRGRAFVEKLGIKVETLAWTGDRLDFGVSTLGQRVDGQIDINPDTVRLEVRLPLLLSFFAGKLQKIVGDEGTKLLAKK